MKYTEAELLMFCYNFTSSLGSSSHLTDLSLSNKSAIFILNAIDKNIKGATRQSIGISAKPSAAQVWGVGLLFVTFISCCAAVGIGLTPLLSRRLYHRILTYFVGLGVGSLSGSAVFHLLPQAFDLVDGGGGHAYLGKSWMAVAGIYVFFFTDKFLKVIADVKKRKKLKHCADNDKARNTVGSKSIPMVAVRSDSECAHNVTTTTLLLPGGGADEKCEKVINGQLTLPEEEEFETQSTDGTTLDAQQAHGMCTHDHEVNFSKGDSVIATVAWMIILGDGLHNFIDGLSIGASFSKSILTGISVSVAVLCEEFPHELGDVAILISAGMTMRQALTYNLLSAATCYIGFFIGIALGELDQATPFIFSLAGGMFLYISLASMVPEMNHATEKHLAKSVSRGLRAVALQAAGIATGLIAMFLMAYFGPSIEIQV